MDKFILQLLMVGSIVALLNILIKEPDIVYKEVPCKPDTVYIEVQPEALPEPQHIDWIVPAGNERLDIKPSSPEERQWQRNRKVYKPKYDYDKIQSDEQPEGR